MTAAEAPITVRAVLRFLLDADSYLGVRRGAAPQTGQSPDRPHLRR